MILSTFLKTESTGFKLKRIKNEKHKTINRIVNYGLNTTYL